MSHSYTLPHSLSHHTSFRMKEELVWGDDLPLDRKYGTVGRKPRDLPRIDCRVRSPAHVVNLLLLIHSQKVRDVVAGRWLEECANKSRPRPSTSLRYFG